MAAKMNWVGRRFGRLVVIAEGEGRKVTALCDCGKITHPATNNLSSGNTKSCGCLGEESKVTRHKTHGMTNTPTYKVWCGIWKRTTNENAVNFERYGGKGVTVSPLWKSFEAFLADMGERPNGMTLDRIDNDKGYVPGNCRWATHPEQRRNTSNTHSSGMGRGRVVPQRRRRANTLAVLSITLPVREMGKKYRTAGKQTAVVGRERIYLWGTRLVRTRLTL